MMNNIILLSGGLDSATALAIAKENKKDKTIALNILYGQKHKKEIKCAKKLCKHYNVPYKELNLSKIFKNSQSSLLSTKNKINKKSYEEQQKKNNIIETYVPFRNGLFLSVAASFGLSYFGNKKIKIWLSNHLDDENAAYADTSIEFVNKINKAISEGTYNLINVYSPFKKLNKSDIVKFGNDLNVPYELTWSCYEGKKKACGKCGTCRDRLKAFKINKLSDPIEYEE